VKGYPTQVLLEAEHGAGSELLEHLLMDRLIKITIVIVASLVLALGMTIIWRTVGRRRP
jgi:hypothetical protein